MLRYQLVLNKQLKYTDKLDAGKNISEHLLSFADLDLINYNDEADWSKYVHDTWHRNAAFKLHVRVARRGDLVTLTTIVLLFKFIVMSTIVFVLQRTINDI